MHWLHTHSDILDKTKRNSEGFIKLNAIFLWKSCLQMEHWRCACWVLLATTWEQVPQLDIGQLNWVQKQITRTEQQQKLQQRQKREKKRKNKLDNNYVGQYIEQYRKTEKEFQYLKKLVFKMYTSNQRDLGSDRWYRIKFKINFC